MGFDARDPWEAAEAVRNGDIDAAIEEESPCRMIRRKSRAPEMAARPMSSAPAAGSRCGCIGDDEAVDFAIVGTGAGGGTLACRLAEAGFSVVAFDAGPYWRPLEDFASDESEQTKLYWTDDRIVDGDNPLQLGSNNSGKLRRRQHRAFRHGLAPLPAGMVQAPAACSATAPTGRSTGGRCGTTTPRSRRR